MAGTSLPGSARHDWLCEWFIPERFGGHTEHSTRVTRMKPMTIEIWSDVVCPWCYIGKRRFEAALARFAQKENVRIIWRSYQLDSQAPRGSGINVKDVLARKFDVSTAQAEAMHARVTALAAAEGLDYRLDQAKYANTFDAHRLIHLAGDHGLQAEAKERLLHAYFTEGRAVDDRETLVEIATDLGIPEDRARAVLAGDAYADEVRADEQRAAMFGIRGVPFFAIDEHFGISGAQPVEAILETLQHAWAEGHPLASVVTGDGDGICEDGTCATPPGHGG
jgi:predicted DsbA family dithiol-disulfide isomerase